MMAGIRLAGYHIEAGSRKFADFAKAMIEDIGAGIKPYLKTFYEAIRNWPGFDPTDFDNQEFVSKFDINSISDVLNRPGNGKQDSPDPKDAVPDNGKNVSGNGSGSGQNGSGYSQGNREGNKEPNSGKSSNNDITSFTGKQSDNKIYPEIPGGQEEFAGNFDGRGRSIISSNGDVDNPEGIEDDNRDPYPVSKEIAKQLSDKRKLQKEANDKPFKLMDETNIRDSLPFLLPEQQNDVVRAETRIQGF